MNPTKWIETYTCPADCYEFSTCSVIRDPTMIITEPQMSQRCWAAIRHRARYKDIHYFFVKMSLVVNDYGDVFAAYLISFPFIDSRSKLGATGHHGIDPINIFHLYLAIIGNSSVNSHTAQKIRRSEDIDIWVATKIVKLNQTNAK